jgi:hypothetical protein
VAEATVSTRMLASKPGDDYLKRVDEELKRYE